ncbi:hypothetical protein AVEN_195616-1 [Araneus ventricosus]|uniref:Uncharacterized protein n=1 Tax=Araneus ventricosus TaxID=182803 RepID=A0A4Y2BBA1_ARAVE|nr:hypothetical protein AVEN_195616-1 [Araneus ventricosus]
MGQTVHKLSYINFAGMVSGLVVQTLSVRLSYVNRMEEPSDQNSCQDLGRINSKVAHYKTRFHRKTGMKSFKC